MPAGGEHTSGVRERPASGYVRAMRLPSPSSARRSSSNFFASTLLCAATLAGCGGDDERPPAADAGPRDLGASMDASPPADLGGSDTGTPDLGAPDLGPPPACDVPTLPALATETVGSGFSAPIALTFAPGDDGAVYVAERAGRIRRVAGGTTTSFLDMRSAIGSAPGGEDERGLLGLAFAPDYATSGRFFVGYTPTTTGSDANIVAEYRRSGADPLVADPTQVARLVEQSDPAGNHNGGWIGFGPDGFLYAAIGDGGGAGDRFGTFGNGLNPTTLLGKMLRLDIDAAASGYAAAGNPFEAGGGLPQIWALGLRNPWRNAFDRETGELYIADVGQNEWEELNIQPSSSAGGENYGWRAYEGLAVFDRANTSRVPVHTEPVYVYRHGSDTVMTGGRSITGGHVYRGTAIPALRGVYLFGDPYADHVGALRFCDGMVRGPVRATDLGGLASALVSFGEDADGELYLLYLDGTVLKVVPG